jgi:hypothetical protein
MSRKNIFDTLLKKYNVSDELHRISALFNSKIFVR